jgi:adenine-specific DNA-methyltransferase
MEKGREGKDLVGENVEAYKHETETRKNAVPVGLASYDTSKLKPKKFEYEFDRLTFRISQAFFPNSSAWDRLKRALKASIDEDKFELLANARSIPSKLGKEKRIAVKVIDHRGNEVMVVREMEKAISEKQLR